MHAASLFGQQRQDFFLRFTNRELEAEFFAYIHPKPLKAFPVVTISAVVLYIFLELTTPGIGFWVNIPWYFVMFLASVIIHVQHKRTGKPEYLWAERIIWTLLICEAITFDTYAYYNGTAANCSNIGEVAIDSTKAFRKPHCDRWLNTVGVSAVVLLTSIQIVPFTYMIATAMYYSPVLVVMYWLTPPPDPAIQVGMFAALIIPTVIFIAFVRREQEQVQRRLFLRYRELEKQRQLLSAKERALSDFCSVILPKAVLWRLGQLNASTAVDATDNGVVLLCSIHNFGQWCTQQAPLDVCTTVVHLQTLSRMLAERCGVEFIGSVGDMTVCVANLIKPVVDGPQRACRLGSSLLQHVDDNAKLPPLSVAINEGPLRGGFAGTLTLRYVVFGECYDAAGAALLNCPPGRAILGPSVREAAAASQQGSDSEANITEVEGLPERGTDFAVFELQTMNVSVPTGSVTSDPTSGNQTFLEMVTGALAASSSAVGHVGMQIQSPTAAAYARGGVRNSPRPAASTSVEIDGSAGMTSNTLRDHLQRYKRIRTVWCCFQRFEDDDLEEAFVNERIDELPRAGSRTWLAYAALTAVVLMLLVADFQGPNAIVGAIMLIVASLSAAIVGALPRLVTHERMRSLFFPWSVVGSLLPLLVVYGCAITRPSTVGNDPMLYPVLGALVRSYCFASTRWQVVVTIIAAIAGYAQLLLPGGLTRGVSFLAPILIITVILVAEKQREAEYRANTRRKVELAVVLDELRKVEALREGLLRAAVPPPVAKIVRRQMLLNVHESSATQCDAVAVLLRAPPIPVEAGALPTLGDLSKQFAPLELALATARQLSLAALMGDQAAVVGPIGARPPAEDETEVAIREAVELGFTLGEAAAPFSVLVDYDSVVHAIMHGEFAQYWALGVTVTRLMAVMAAADASVLRRFLATERLLLSAGSLRLLDDSDSQALGPMKFRGAGMVRFTRLRRRAQK